MTRQQKFWKHCLRDFFMEFNAVVSEYITLFAYYTPYISIFLLCDKAVLHCKDLSVIGFNKMLIAQ